MRLRFPALLTVGLLALATSPAGAQIPNEFTNLQVLPEEIERQELVNIMRGFSGALGVRCNFCHVGDSPDSLEGYDFASDEKNHKKIARVMMEMTNDINGVYLPKMGKASPFQVTCMTCHEGQKEPSTLQAELMEAFDDGGTDALVERYRELRRDHYGDGVFNFGESSLLRVATELARGRQDLAAAAKVIDLNLEQFPDSHRTWVSLGNLRQMSGDTDGAIDALEKALELEPDNPRIRQLLERLRS